MGVLYYNSYTGNLRPSDFNLESNPFNNLQNRGVKENNLTLYLWMNEPTTL